MAHIGGKLTKKLVQNLGAGDMGMATGCIWLLTGRGRVLEY